jgi:DNA-binding transcriptional ArsR family regulator
MTHGVAPRVGRPTQAEVAAREGREGRVIRALGHQTRRQILLFLEHDEKPVHGLADHFDVSRPMVSKHLRVLVQAGLVQGRQVGRERRYALVAGADLELAMSLARADAAHHAHMERLRDRLTKGGKD